MLLTKRLHFKMFLMYSGRRAEWVAWVSAVCSFWPRHGWLKVVEGAERLTGSESEALIRCLLLAMTDKKKVARMCVCLCVCENETADGMWMKDQELTAHGWLASKAQSRSLEKMSTLKLINDMACVCVGLCVWQSVCSWGNSPRSSCLWRRTVRCCPQSRSLRPRSHPSGLLGCSGCWERGRERERERGEAFDFKCKT